MSAARSLFGRQVRVPAEQGGAIGSGHPHAGRRPDDVAEPYPLLKSRVERVDRCGGPVIDGVGLRALRSLGVDDLEWRDVAAMAVVVRPDRGRRGDLEVVAERLALLERRHQREHLRRGAGLDARARAVSAVDRVVNGCLARPCAERAVDRDRPDVASARLDQHLGVGVVARIVIARIRRLDEVDGMTGGSLITGPHRRVDRHAAGLVQGGPHLGVERVGSQHREHVVAEECSLAGRIAEAAGLQRKGRRVQPERLTFRQRGSRARDVVQPRHPLQHDVAPAGLPLRDAQADRRPRGSGPGQRAWPPRSA